MKVLAGDIGGTKTLLQIAEVEGNQVAVLHRARFSSQDYAEFETLLGEYLEQVPAAIATDIASACFGIAGPISSPEHGPCTAQVTNLPWRLDEAQLSTRLAVARVHLINDFYATASGIDALGAEDLAVLHPGTPQSHAPRLVVGAGTGLGVAQLLWSEGRYRALPSEGGHIHFAPTDAEQDELLDYMKSYHERVSYERLVSGTGLSNIYRFLQHRHSGSSDGEHPSPLESPDPAAAITEQAQRGDALAQKTVSLFLSIYGAVVGDLALVSLAYGGIYVAGGIAPKLLSEMRDGTFMQAFLRKGRMSPLVEQMPINIILNQAVGLLGATLVPTRT
ncbi:MAG: glucokinase [Gammaproteobacteria bacterium]